MVPKSIKIGGHKFQVEAVSQKTLGEEYLGEMDEKTNTIKVACDIARSRQAETLLHECLHAMLTGHTFKEEEKIVVILSQGLTQLIKDNPRLFTKMIAALSDRKKSS